MKKFMNIAIIEDDQGWHFLIQKILADSNHFKIELTCLIGNDFFDRISQHHIDLVLLDINLPIANGFIIADRIIKEFPDLPVVIFTSSYNESDISMFYHSGAKAYLNKSRLIYLNDDLLKIIGLIKNSGYKFQPITYQDIELMEMVCKKMTYNEMAEKLGTTTKNIENNLKRFCSHVNIQNSKLHIYEFAVRYGFWNPWEP